ncbi:hypothetical protein [Neisseria wadsworthii]|uniref:Uncharacterized protein n=1 Tax=Neisseria wadsworthii 9715 TaxID=1030841 RepID=G4CRC4_9NEIS|nr:hypothetical protein [Neisseria wadsworthii]EGZ45344.1 hypothetical protein HMPREF9370_1634 [Neisseria wadsworthii 9715]QMT35333.1 hypothetical protein H3L96_09855 [Neisseria wadsworthii]
MMFDSNMKDKSAGAEYGSAFIDMRRIYLNGFRMISRNYSDAMEEIDCPRILWKMTIHVNEYTEKLKRISFGLSAIQTGIGQMRAGNV